MRANTENRNRHTGAKISVWALAIGLGVNARAEAQVIEIGRDGSMVVYDQPALITPESAVPIAGATPSPKAQSVPAHIARSFDQAGSDAALVAKVKGGKEHPPVKASDDDLKKIVKWSLAM